MKWLIRIVCFIITTAIYIPIESALHKAGTAKPIIWIITAAIYFFIFYIPSNAIIAMRNKRTNNTNIAKSVMDILCRNQVDFISKGWGNDNLTDMMFFWSALYYSVYDILLKHNIATAVAQEFHIFLYAFGRKYSIDSEGIDAAIHFQETTLNTLKEAVPDPLTKDGMAKILDLACIVCGPDDDSAEITSIGAITMFEYTLAVQNTVAEIANLLSAK